MINYLPHRQVGCAGRNVSVLGLGAPLGNLFEILPDAQAPSTGLVM